MGPVAGVVRGPREVGEADRSRSAGALDLDRVIDFARVLAEVVAARGTARSSPWPQPAGPASAGSAEARLTRALAADTPMQWLAAPLVQRAIDAYRELTNAAA
jgi:hypothetical protein